MAGITDQFSNKNLPNASSTVPGRDMGFPIRPELPPEMKDFQLCDSIGFGSTGTVFRSIQTKEFAVKVVPWLPNNLRDIAKREYDIASSFADCDKILHVIAYYEHDCNSFILQEIGEPIIDYFIRHICTLKMLLQALLDISDALSFIHSKGYTHFDVKPSNILVVKDRARLGDFSHCRRYVKGQEYERSMGTSPFMAPEIVSGAEHSGLEDMYSLGITMYTLLMAGPLPVDELQSFGADTNEKGRKKITSMFIHPDLLSIIQRAAARDPADSYQAFEDFSKDICSFMKANNDSLEETVPTYFAINYQRPTVPPFFNTLKTNPDLS